jgi:hypothetical protein
MTFRSIGRPAAAIAGITLKRLQRLAVTAALGLAAFGIADQAAAGVTFTGQFGASNSWNVYEAIGTQFTFKQALAFAQTRPDPTGGSAVGHLVTLGGLAENDFVYTTAGSTDRWIGLTDRVGAAPGASESQFAFDPLHEGWAWVTGEPFTFENWQRNAMGVPTEPNNSGGTEDAAHMWGGGFWNDNASGFGLNDPVPDTVTFDSPAEGEATMGFVIEWDKNLPTPPSGFPGNRPDPALPRIFPSPLARLPGPPGNATALGVLEITGLGASGGTRAAIGKILGTGGTRVEGTAARFDLHDPESGANQGSVPGPQIPFLSNTAADDNNIQSVIKGTFAVPVGQGGDYTFNVRSDDGFAMRILSQPTGGPLTQHRFTAARSGLVDEDGSIAFLQPTGDSNTQALMNLAPGTYDFEFAVFEDGGGAFWEVSTARGDFLNPSPGARAQWLLLGNGASVPQSASFKQPVRLTGPATAKNRARGSITNVQQIVADYRANATGTHEGMVDEVVLNGDGGLGIHGGDLPAGMVHQFPNGTGIDQFTTAVTGGFSVLDTDGAMGETLTFGLFADDNAALHIIGRNFTGVSDFDGTPTTNVATLGNPEGLSDQWLIADYRTGNTNAFGLITLPEGNYNFESFMLEEGGGAALEVWAAVGNLLATGYDPVKFFPLTIDTMPDQFLAANQGLGLVAPPGTGPSTLPGLAGDFNGDGRVNAADYVVWRKTDGTPAGYNLWRTNFGRTAGSGSSLGAVPEPASALLVVVGMIGGALISRRRAN